MRLYTMNGFFNNDDSVYMIRHDDKLIHKTIPRALDCPVKPGNDKWNVFSLIEWLQ